MTFADVVSLIWQIVTTIIMSKAKSDEINKLLCEALYEVKAHMAGELELPEAKDLLSTAELQSIRQGMDDIRHGRTHRMNEGECLSEFIDRYIENDDLTNPSILIIPDVHGRTFWREAVEKYPQLPTIFLGDYLDPFPNEKILPMQALAEFEQILQFKRENSNRVTLLLGNHDIHYLIAGKCAGRKDVKNHVRIRDLFRQHLQDFQLCKLVSLNGKQFLFSHAGIIRGWFSRYFPEVNLENTEEIAACLNAQLQTDEQFMKFMREGLADISLYRGGKQLYGSMVWADMEEHQEEGSHLPNVYQVFGHTQQYADPVIEGCFANLDCRKAFLLLEDGIRSEGQVPLTRNKC